MDKGRMSSHVYGNDSTGHPSDPGSRVSQKKIHEKEEEEENLSHTQIISFCVFPLFLDRIFDIEDIETRKNGSDSGALD